MSLPVYLVRLRITEPLLVHTQMAHFGHQLIWMSKETRTEQKREDVCPLQVNKNLIKVCNNMFFIVLSKQN